MGSGGTSRSAVVALLSHDSLFDLSVDRPGPQLLQWCSGTWLCRPDVLGGAC